jgi:polar amino acid transport system substrate-binding protein
LPSLIQQEANVDIESRIIQSQLIIMKKLLLCVMISILCYVHIASATDSTPKTVKIAVKEFPPLVFNDLSGFCIDLVNIICEEINMHPEFIMVKSAPDLIRAVETGDCDIGFAGITITPEREKRIDFSQPYFESGLMIAVRNEPTSHILSIWSAVLKVIGLSLLLLFAGLSIVAHLVWWIERDDEDPQGFPTSYSKGIIDAYWWAVVTMSTVGYGDKRPKKISGRSIAAIWMFIGIIWFAGLTATLSSSLTLDRMKKGEINDLSDLYGKKVAVIEGTTSEDFLRYQSVKIVPANSLDDLLEKLNDGQSDAIVYDAPPLMYEAKKDSRIKVVGSMFAKQRYGIVFQNTGNEELKELFDIQIMTIQQNGEYQKIYNKWF